MWNPTARGTFGAWPRTCVATSEMALAQPAIISTVALCSTRSALDDTDSNALDDGAWSLACLCNMGKPFGANPCQNGYGPFTLV